MTWIGALRADDTHTSEGKKRNQQKKKINKPLKINNSATSQLLGKAAAQLHNLGHHFAV